MRQNLVGLCLLLVGVVLGATFGPQLRDLVLDPTSVSASGPGAVSVPQVGDQAPPAASASPPVLEPVVVGVGDSITYLKGSWFRRVCAAQVLTGCVNAAVNGDTTIGILDRMDADVLAKKPDVVIVMAGTNDLSLGEPTADIVRRLDVIIDRARDAGAATILCTVPPRDRFGPAAIALNRAIRAYAAGGRVPLLDLYDTVGQRGGRFLRGQSLEGVHPSPSGQRRMAALAERRLPALLLAARAARDSVPTPTSSPTPSSPAPTATATSMPTATPSSLPRA